MSRYEDRIRQMSPEELDAEIEVERRAALPRWLAWAVMAAGFAGFIVAAVVGRG